MTVGRVTLHTFILMVSIGFILQILQNLVRTAYAADSHLQSRPTESLRWQHRLLFVRCSSPAQKRLLKTWQTQYQAQLRERKLLILAWESSEIWKTQKPTESKFWHNLAISNAICKDCIYLVGLDGGIKLKTALNADNLNKIFAVIDAMPMRRSELLE